MGLSDTQHSPRTSSLILPDHYLFQELCTVAQRCETQNQKVYTQMLDKEKKAVMEYNSNHVIPPPAA